MVVPLLLPTPRDARLAAQLLGDDAIATTCCADIDALERAIARPVGAVFVAEEWLLLGAHDVIVRALARQPAWSDLPIVVVARVGSESHHLARLVDQLGNATVLERPLRVATLASTAKTALRARWRQYQIRDQLDALEGARAELDRAARRKDEFLAILGHELRNPLAPIRNALHVLQPRLPPGDQPLVALMERQVEHMVRLVDDLVDVARVTRGTIELRRERVAVADVLGRALELSRPLLRAGRHELELDVRDEGMVVIADAVRLTQVFGNLLNNAAKYSAPGGHVRVVVAREGGDCVVSVIDRGIGIEPEVLPHVFELFTQGTHGAHRAKDGLGIGLTLVRTLVQLHGGEVTARSDPARPGSEFRVRLPLAPDPARAAPRDDGPSAAASAQAFGSLRALVVDDNVDAAETLGMLLSAMGLSHRVVFNGRDALAAVTGGFEPDVVFLDLGMPLMDGFEVARRLRRHDAGRDALLVALTGWNQAEDVARSRDAGFDHHLAKPADLRELIALLSRIHANAV